MRKKVDGANCDTSTYPGRNPCSITQSLIALVVLYIHVPDLIRQRKAKDCVDLWSLPPHKDASGKLVGGQPWPVDGSSGVPEGFMFTDEGRTCSFRDLDGNGVIWVVRDAVRKRYLVSGCLLASHCFKSLTSYGTN